MRVTLLLGLATNGYGCGLVCQCGCVRVPRCVWLWIALAKAGGNWCVTGLSGNELLEGVSGVA